MTCLVCRNVAFRGLLMQDKDMLAFHARNFIDGLVLCAARNSKDSLKIFEPPPRRGISIVERCALMIEGACARCQEPGCQRCRIAAELRAAEKRINGERDVELAELGFDDKDLEGVIDKMAGGLCKDHVAFGAVLVGQWYSRNNFSIL